MKYDILIVGAGISGLTLAERYSTVLNKKVLLIDIRDHIGGNCYDYINEIGILVPKYGPHFFHTNNEKVWDYVSKFTEWTPYEHRVLAKVKKKLVPVPVNITTVNKLFNLKISNEDEMEKFLEKERQDLDQVLNSEDSALKRVGKRIYELIFKNYTIKQWDMLPSDLNPSVLNRIPIRNNFDDRYFTDKYQAMPKNGYTKLFKKMIKSSNIEVKLNTDYFELKENLLYQKMFFTGPIDRFFDFLYKEKLQYRSLKFKHENLNQEYFQNVAQVNYPNNFKFTRITEPKHSYGKKNKKTTIIKEYPTWKGEGYYPVPNERNLNLYYKYQSIAKEYEKQNIYFVGRLATYKYINMDEAFNCALELFEKLEPNVT